MIPEFSEVKPSTALRLGLQITLEPGWHTYGENPGDSGMRTKIEWLSPNLSSLPISWPTPEKFASPPLATYGYKDSIFLLTGVVIPSTANLEFTLRARASWLVCKEICIPQKENFTLTFPVSTEAGLGSPEFSKLLALTLPRIPTPVSQPFPSQQYRSYIRLSVPISALPEMPDQLQFVPGTEGTIDDGFEQPVSTTGENKNLFIKKEEAGRALDRLQGLVSYQLSGKSFHQSFSIDQELPQQLDKEPNLPSPGSGTRIVLTALAVLVLLLVGYVVQKNYLRRRQA